MNVLLIGTSDFVLHSNKIVWIQDTFFSLLLLRTKVKKIQRVRESRKFKRRKEKNVKIWREKKET